jgi:hypothetical protein
MWKGNLISCGTNAKTIKGDGDELLTAIMYLIPWKSFGANLCPSAELAACHGPCLVSAGRGAFSSVIAGRARKTEWYIKDRAGFMAQLVIDVTRFVKYCNPRNIKPCIRLNGTSDIRWEQIPVVDAQGNTHKNIMEAFPMVQFYDYTKIANRRNVPNNYHLTWSYSGSNPKYSDMMSTAVANGMNVAVVFRTKGAIPASFKGLPTVDGDKNDLRFQDDKGVAVALYAKGKAKYDTSGFVQG